jgi:hypothetical protein
MHSWMVQRICKLHSVVCLLVKAAYQAETIGQYRSQTMINDSSTDEDINRFLWVRFQLDEISEAATDDAIRMAIQNLPKDLAETYARILTKIWNSAGGSSKFDLAKQIFKWVICARRPLTVEELSEAMAVSVDCDSLDINKVPSGDGYHLLQACGNLLNVDRNDQTVRLAHHTVGKFLVSDQPQFATYGSLHFTQSKAEADIGVMCVTYLSFSDFETQIVKKGSLSMIVNVSTIQSNIWRRIPCGNTVRSVLSATRRSSTLAEEDAFLIRLAGHQSQDPLVQAPQRKYVLLEYIASFWAWHTSHFEESTVSEKTWNLFRELAFDRQFLFDAKPWDTMETRAAKIDKSVPHIPLLRWTIDEGVASFVRLIFHTGNGYNPDLDFEKFHVYFSHERKNGMNLLVRASQKENNQTFDLLLHYISIKDFPHRNFLENSDMLLEVASLSNSHLKKLTHMGGDSLSPSIQLALNKAIERGNALSVQRLVSAGGRVDFFGSSHSLKRNASASFLEVAAATGKSERIGLLCQYNPPGNLIIRAARLTIDRNHQEAFLTLLACYLHYGPWVGTFLLSASSNQLEGSKNQLHELLSSLPSDSADFLGRRDIINACQRAGIVVRLATDEVCGARHYAEMIGILAKGGIVLDASSFRSHMSQQQYNGLPFLQVLSDCDDQDIHFLAESLRESGKVVGISRVLSLLKEDRRKSADITMDI